ncbi:hypothetical protein GGD66_002389 [Bradyrhizobium sp. CIR48]|nr:hypothetical protein [Bradyrhizobium sp. CIR48]
MQVPAASVMLDYGEIERRVSLVRPMEQHTVPLTHDGGEPLGRGGP